MGRSVRFSIFILFSLALFVTVQRNVSTPLASFAFFPFGFLIAFHFYASGGWVFSLLTLGLLLTSYVFRGTGLLTRETTALTGTSVACFLFLVYGRYVWQRRVKEETERCQAALSELIDLRQRHATRHESLLHLEKQVASLINLFEVARDFNECLDLKEATLILHKKVLPELPFKKAELILLDRDKKGLPSISRVYVISKSGVEESFAVERGAVEQQWLATSLRHKGFVGTEDGLWIFPLTPEGEFSALFVILGSSKEDLAKFEVLAAQLALQVRKVRLYEMVRELSIIDGLTGVFVRRHFLERFEEEIGRAKKQNFPLTVLMLDIDHFKRYNDDFGHLVGDATLKEVAQIIRANVRNVDIVARYGGEEFAVVIPETREEGGLEVAERIRSAVARKSFRVYDEETKVTVSIGVSIYPQDLPPSILTGETQNILFELIQRADRALYRAKEEGRNRVIVYRSFASH